MSESQNGFFNKFLFSQRAQRIFIVCASMFIGLTVLLFDNMQFFVFERFRMLLYDSYTGLISDNSNKNSVAIVNIDDRSLYELGQWPWPRYRIAKLLLELRKAEAAGVSLDIIFPEPDRTSPVVFKEAYRNEFGIDIHLEGLPDVLSDNDEILAGVLAGGPFVLGNFAFFEDEAETRNCILTPLDFEGDISLMPELYRSGGFLCNIPKISTAVRYKGFFNAVKDSDGTVRRGATLTLFDGRLYPSLAFATFLDMTKSDKIIIDKDFNGVFLKAGGKKIRVDPQGNVLLKISRDNSHFDYFSAYDIISGNFDPSEIKGRQVIVGSDAVGLNDFHSVFGNSAYSGVKVHATLVNNILSDESFFIPAWSGWLERISVILLSLFIGYLMSYKNTALNFAVITVSLFAVLTGSFFTMALARMFISPAAALIALVSVFIFVISVNYFIEVKKSLQWAVILNRTHQATIDSMATVAETRDPETGAHIIRTQYYVKSLAEYLSSKEKYRKVLTPEFIELLFKSAPMHDIGKVGVPDNILLKQGRLTAEEFEEMKKHAEYGRKILSGIQAKFPDNEFIRVSADIAYTHHEKWNGSGYPRGLRGEEIPVSGRLMAVADVYDALVSKRHYKDKMSYEEAKKIIVEGRGTHFDPDIVDAFLAIFPELVEISERYAEKSSEQS